MKLKLLLITVLLLVFCTSLVAQDGATSIYARVGGGVDNDKAFTGHFAVGTSTPLGQGFHAVSVLAYQQFDLTGMQSLGDEQEFYLSGLIRKELFDGFFIGGGGSLERLDYTGDDLPAETYGAGTLEIMKEWTFKYAKIGVAGSMHYVPGKSDEVGTTTFIISVQGAFEINADKGK